MFKKTILTLNLLCSIVAVHARVPILVLDPEGDVMNNGRKLATGYERNETLQFAEELKKTLMKTGEVRVVIAHTSRKKKSPYQAVSFANRVKADLFITLTMVTQEDVKPSLALYYRSLNPLTEQTPQRQPQLSLTPVSLAHSLTILATKNSISRIHEVLTEPHYLKLMHSQKPLGIPIKPLAGLTVPGLLMEVGVSRHSSWNPLVKPVSDSLERLFHLSLYGAEKTSAEKAETIAPTNEEVVEDADDPTPSPLIPLYPEEIVALDTQIAEE